MSVIQKPQLAEEINIVAADLVGTYKLRLTFSDGKQSLVDFEPFLRSAGHPHVRAYLDPDRFGRFGVRVEEPAWGDYELCFPIADLYDGRI